MAYLIGMPRAAWKRQPSNNYRIRWEHSLVSSLNIKGIIVVSDNPYHYVEAFGNRSYFVVKNKIIFTPNGVRTGLYGGGSTPLSSSVCKVNGNSRSLFVVAQAITNDTSSYPLAQHSGIGVSANKDGVKFTIGTTVSTYNTNVIMPNRKDFFNLWAIWDYSVNTGTLYIDDTTESVVTSGTHTTSASSVTLGGVGDRGIYLAVICEGAITDQWLLQELKINPWQLFYKAPSLFYLIPSGASSYQLVSSFASASSSSTAALNIQRILESTCASLSSTSSISLISLIPLLSALASASETATSAWQVLRALQSALASDSSTSPAALAIERALISALTSASLSTDSALNVQRNFLTALSSESNAPAITLSIAGLMALLSALSSQSSTATSAVSVQRALLSALTSQSATGDITLNTETLIALLSAVASSSLSSASALNIARALSTAINSPSTTADVALPVQRPFVTAQTSQSSTSISVLELINLIGLASAVSSQSSTSTAMANLARALVSELLSASSTATIPLPVIRNFAATLVSASLTDAIDLSLVMLGQIDLVSLIESASLTNPKARLLVDLVVAIQSEMKVQMTGVAPSFTMTDSGSSISMTRI